MEHEVELIQELIQKGQSYSNISSVLKGKYPTERGLSERSVRRFCREVLGITKNNNISKGELHDIVSSHVSEVGSSYGRKMLTGKLRASGVRVAEVRVGDALKRVNPEASATRLSTAGRSLNPKVYHADYFGHKLHVDQNEKLVFFGCTHVCARDGYSGMIVAFLTLPIKNNVTIYNAIMRDYLTRYGMWDQLRLDGGKEFQLIEFMQEKLADLRTNTARLPVQRTKSTENNTIERIWVEVNKDVNFPIKNYLIAFHRELDLDMSEETTRFCVSWVTCRVASAGVNIFVPSWNEHRIPGKGIPSELGSQNNQCKVIDSSLILSDDAVLQQYKVDKPNGKIKRFSPFGTDPLASNDYLVSKRKMDFAVRFPSFSQIFSNVVSGDGVELKESIRFFIHLTVSSVLST